MGVSSITAFFGILSACTPALLCAAPGADRGDVQDEQVAPKAEDRAGDVDFALEVRPLLARKCFACHGNDEETREAGLRLDSFEAATADRNGFPALTPNSLEDSELWHRILDDVDPMPPAHAGEMLGAGEQDLLRRWIEAGAAYAPHWSFVPPVRPEVPQAVDGEHPIDAFVGRMLRATTGENGGIDLGPRADDATLFRRLSLDLTGLPPGAAAAKRFSESTDPDKIETAIDGFLASPAYAERWAAVWLDLARYADSAGHGSDPLRTIWRYRDWVIEAFDQNMPFDRFTVEQLAGDLLPEATVETRLATAFHRNTMTNTEGGTDDEEFRVLAVKDRVNTTMQVWMGLTAGCAECHSHKYDPISHHDYYALFDVFNQTADNDRGDEEPKIETPTREQAVEWERLGAALEDIDQATEARIGSFDADEGLERMLLETIAASTAVTGGVTIESLGKGEAAAPMDDGSYLVTGGGDRATRVLSVSSADAAPTALVFDALTDESLPKSGPGRNSTSGNFVLTQLSVRAHALEPRSALVSAVRIDLPGEMRILSLAEVQLLGPGGQVLSAEGSPTQSSTYPGGEASHAFDGTTDGVFANGSVSHTSTSNDPYWQLDLALPAKISGVRLWTRTDGFLADRLHGYRVTFLGGEDEVVWESALAPAFRVSEDIGPAVGEPLRMTAASATHEQRNFGASKAVDGRWSMRDGWAVGGQEGVHHAAVFALPPLDGPRRLEVTMEHRFGTAHVPGRIRLAVSTAQRLPFAIASSAFAALQVPRLERNKRQRKDVTALMRQQDPELMKLQARRAELVSDREALDVVKTPVMEELPAEKRRDSHVLLRGNFLQKGEKVAAAIPAAFGVIADEDEGGTERPLDRLRFARWLVSQDNPLTARVAVNRVWARLFGRGLVATEGDFGSQGATPTHPELLDWLAVEFRDGGDSIPAAWDHRGLVRAIVTSRTYQQSSVLEPDRAALDPNAILLSRYPRQRLEAEMVRDTALSVAGLLSTKRFGPSVFPPQPDGLWQAAFNGQRNWTTSMGEDRYRRGLYVFMRRTIPYPMLDTFDAPSRELCTVQRISTNTPLQAFVTMNDVVFVEAAQAFARQLLALDDGDDGDEARMKAGFWAATGRAPTADQVEILISLLRDARTEFAGDPDGARAFSEEPIGALPPGMAAEDAAAWTLVASSLLNLDSTLTKE